MRRRKISKSSWHLAAAGDEHRRGLEDHLAEGRQAGRAQRRPGLHHVGDHVGDAELDARLDRAVEAGDGRVDAVAEEVVLDHADVRRRDPQALEVLQRGVAPGGAGEVEARAAEPEVHHLVGLRAGVEQQVAAGDADVERALADVERDVARAQVEELDVVLGVDERELLGVAALAVAGLAQDLGGGLGQRPLVGDGDAEGHAGFTGSLTGGRRRRRGSGRRRA